jgi:hypothetical protein
MLPQAKGSGRLMLTYVRSFTNNEAMLLKKQGEQLGLCCRVRFADRDSAIIRCYFSVHVQSSFHAGSFPLPSKCGSAVSKKERARAALV